MKRTNKTKSMLSLLLIITMITIMLPLELVSATSNNLQAGSYNVIGFEDFDYDLDLEVVKRNSSFTLDEEKLSFYMLGCDLLSSTADRMEFEIRSEKDGAKFVFIAPEAGRKSGILQTKDFYTYANSILRVKDVDKIIYEKQGEHWKVILGEEDILPEMWLEEKNGSNEKLKYDYHSSEIGAENPFIIDLENYTIKREEGFFKMSHVFSPKALIYESMSNPTITFKSDEILLRTFETRLSQDNEEKRHIYVDRKPSPAIIGNIIRFGSNSDDGANLSTITGIDPNNNKIYINRYNSINYNTPEKGKWLRCFSDFSSGQVIDNEYPKVYLEPTIWSINEEEIGDLLNNLIDLDPTGLMGDLRIDLDDEDNFGYGLNNVSYSYDGLNFVGGLSGSFDVEQEINFFGQSANIGPVHIDYSSMANSIMDQILRINTYKREAFRFYFNPKFLENDFDWGASEFVAPDKFPLTFRLYFDKNFELIGGNMRINMPGKGIPMPGGLIFVDNLGGGFTYPRTFNVAGVFQTYLPLWYADADLTLSLDQKYLYLEGKCKMFKKKVRVGDFDATVAWSYYTGKRFKGVEVGAETGMGSKYVNLIADITFKYKKYKSQGKIKTYIGASGRGRVEAFGSTFGNVGVYFNTKRVKGTVKLPIIGRKSFRVSYSKITKSITSLSANANLKGNLVLLNEKPSYGVATFYDEFENEIVLIPEAKRIPQNIYLASASVDSRFLLLADNSTGTTLNLPSDVSEAAITIDYEGTLEGVSVQLPDGSTKQVIIADEDTIEEEDKLYAMDYDLDDNTRQMYIQIKDAQSGDYQLSYTETNIISTDIYEIVAVPQIVEDSLEASFDISDNTVALNWELEEEIPADVRHHLTMVNMENGEIVDEYPIYEDLVDEDEETVTENYITNQAITITNGTNISTKIKLNDNLLSGDYAFRVEPVLYQEGEDQDNLYGQVSYSNEISYSQKNFPVSTPEYLTVESVGNGVTRVMWKYDPLAYGWDINIIDETGNAISKTTIVNSEIDSLTNIYIDPISSTSYVYENIGLESNVFADVLLQNIKYDIPYTFEVRAIKRIPHGFDDGQYYDPINNYIDLNKIEAELNEGDLVYISQASSEEGEFVEGEKINFYVEIYEEGKDEPVFSANAFEGDTGEIGYSYDLDEDTDMEGLRQIDPGALVLRTNAMDSIRLIPDNDVEKIGIIVLSPSGEEIVNIPALDMSILTSSINNPSNIIKIGTELKKSYPDLSFETINQIKRIYQSGAFTLPDGQNLDISFARMVSARAIDDFEPGRYTICLEAYRANNDLTLSRFEVVIRDIVPTVFIENIRSNGEGSFTLVGYANGAQDVSLNGVSASVDGGIFELDTAIDSDVISYLLTDEFGNMHTGILAYEEYNEPSVFTVTFVDYDNSVLKTEEVEEGKGATAPADPTRTGYTFTGWDVSFSNITRDLTVKAEFENIQEAAAKAAVITAESSKTQADMDTAQALVTALPDGEAKDDLQGRLDAIVIVEDEVDECFIATAAFGTKFTPVVALLRQFRDNYLLTNTIGTAFVNFYYNTSPSIANFIAGDEALKGVARIALVPAIIAAYLIMNPLLLIVFILLMAGIYFSYRRRKTMN